MSITVSVRVDDETAKALGVLAEEAGSRNAAILAAIRETYRRHVLERVRAESAALAADPDYQADVREAREEMGVGDAW